MSKSYFELQREALVGEVSESLESVLQELNKLNRSLESVIAVGNEFSSVEALWSQFETVIAKGGDNPTSTETSNQGGNEISAGEKGKS